MAKRGGQLGPLESETFPGWLGARCVLAGAYKLDTIYSTGLPEFLSFAVCNTRNEIVENF
jgi:hypothetical protein